MSYVLRCLEMSAGSLTITVLRFVGSKQILSFKLPIFSFPSTSTKLLIHGVASCTGFKTPAFSSLSISCLKACFKCTGTGLKGICLGVIFGSNLYVVWGTWKASNTLKYIWVPLYTICSLLVTNLGTSCCQSDTVAACFEL